jgi:hypothetical protein
VAFDDGAAISTVVNPQRDLADARAAYDISVDDVLLAPTLAEAWSVLSPLLDGCTPVGLDIDGTLGLVDHELKRLGVVAPLPVGVEIPRRFTADDRWGVSAPTALARARAAMAVFRREGGDALDGAPFDAGAAGGGADAAYLLTRDVAAQPPVSAAMPTLTGLVEVSRALSAVILGGTDPAAEVLARVPADPATAAAVREVVAERLTSAAGRTTGLPVGLVARLRRLEALLGTEVVDALVPPGAAHGAIGEVLRAGARVCFTGTAVDPAGRPWARDEVNAVAAARGLVPVASVTRSRCEALVVAEVGTQSGKARKAKELGTPVFSAEEFFAWLGTDAHR